MVSHIDYKHAFKGTYSVLRAEAGLENTLEVGLDIKAARDRLLVHLEQDLKEMGDAAMHEIDVDTQSDNPLHMDMEIRTLLDDGAGERVVVYSIVEDE